MRKTAEHRPSTFIALGWPMLAGTSRMDTTTIGYLKRCGVGQRETAQTAGSRVRAHVRTVARSDCPSSALLQRSSTPADRKLYR
jgi:hypothetical protein